jgi:hypothetical protein
MVIRRGTFLVPEAPIDGELIEAFPAGKPLRLSITQPRSIPQMRLYWSMLRLVADNLDSTVTTEALHNWIKMRCGVSAAIPLRNGETDYVPGSIAFDKMDQDQFQAFMDRALDLIVGHLIPGLAKPTLEAEARAMLGLAA